MSGVPRQTLSWVIRAATGRFCQLTFLRVAPGHTTARLVIALARHDPADAVRSGHFHNASDTPAAAAGNWRPVGSTHRKSRARLISRLRQREAWRGDRVPHRCGVPLSEGILKGIKVRTDRMSAPEAMRPAVPTEHDLRSGTGRAGWWQEGRALRMPRIVATPRRLAVIEVEADIRRLPEDVFDYVSDPINELEWTIRMMRIEKLTDGPVGVGARYRMGFTSGPPAISEVVQFERPNCWQLRGASRILRSGLRGRVMATGGGSHLSLQMEIQLRRPLGLALSLVRRRMQRELERDIATIKAKLESSHPAGG
jgi:Polyketide cyclase / dehydrase and lipid transport